LVIDVASKPNIELDSDLASRCGFQRLTMERWAGQVVQDLLKKSPPATIWRGTNAKMGRIGTFFPHGMLDGTIKKVTGLDVVEQMVRK
jgi:hypothetical protein